MSAAFVLFAAAGLTALSCCTVARALRVRQRRRLNEAVHELRRPLQRLALAEATSASAWVEPATRALADLDAVINGRRSLGAGVERFSVADLIEGCRARWQPWPGVAFEIPTPTARILGDRQALGAALDNLIANALEHSRGPVRVQGRSAGGELRLMVETEPGDDRRNPTAAVVGSDPRRGHGLRIVGRVAADHGGRLEPATEARAQVPSVLVLPARRRA